MSTLSISSPEETDRAHSIETAVEHASHLLPAQGPIGVFVHHNTLHHFEDLKFEEAVVKAANIFDAEPYMALEAYQKCVASGRILPEDVDAILAAEPNKLLLAKPELDRTTLRRAMLLPGVRDIRAENVEWLIEEGDLLQRLRRDIGESARHRLVEDGAAWASSGKAQDGWENVEHAALQALFNVCIARVGRPAPAPERSARRPHEGLFAACGESLDAVVHPRLIQLGAVYLDQGQAYWPMPGRELGFLRAVRKLLSQHAYVGSKPLRGLTEEVRVQEAAGLSAVDTIEHCLHALGVPNREAAGVIEAELLALPGWAGQFYQLETNPGLSPHIQLPCTLLDFLAVRLTLNLVGAQRMAERNGLGPVAPAWRRPIVERTPPAEQSQRAEAARLVDVAQLTGLSAGVLGSLGDRECARLLEEIAAFDDFERRRVLHLAYERRHEHLILGPLARHRAEWRPATVTRPSAQVFCCIDEREESLRRHIEEIDPSIETFGAAGFYGVAVDYRGIDDAHGSPLCPVVVTPTHAVHEVPEVVDGHLHSLRQARRKLWAQLARGSFLSSRTLVSGWFSAAVLGLFSLFPLTVRVLSPRSYARLTKKLNRFFLPEPRTELTLTSDDEQAHQTIEGLRLGFGIGEQANSVASVLGPAGLTKNFSRLVLVLGHGSTSLNNPHESAHDCGACGGRRGGPNGRLFAAMANRPEVRRLLVARGIVIPADTWFVGGAHDTCNGAIDLFDLDEAPESHHDELARVRRSLDEARARDGHERSRRFEAANPNASFAAGLRHVEERAEHLAEPRPEYGHCTNAVCIVGRRSVTKGLFFDRRAFLTSYDPLQDADGAKLTDLLGAVVPVCGGINLEYYFSFVDNVKYGCGTKLPHNVTGLVGVMNGHASDLRTGLPWQMVEVHEPVRILFLIEALTERIEDVMRANANVRRFIENRWIRLAAMHPETGEITVYRDGVFEPFSVSDAALPEVRSSRDWYGGHLDHLAIARIQSLRPAAA